MSNVKSAHHQRHAAVRKKTLSAQLVRHVRRFLAGFSRDDVFVKTIRSKNSRKIAEQALDLPKTRPFDARVWLDYAFHVALIEYPALAPAFVRYFFSLSEKKKGKFADKILKQRLPAGSKAHLFAALHDIDRTDPIVLALGVQVFCENCELERAKRLIGLIGEADRGAVFVQRACLRYEEMLLDLDLAQPKDLGRTFLLGQVAAKLSEAVQPFESRDCVLHIVPSLGPGGAQKQFVSLMTELRRRSPDMTIYVFPMALKNSQKRFYEPTCSALGIEMLDPERMLEAARTDGIFESSASVSRWTRYLDGDVERAFLGSIAAIYQCRPRTLHAWSNKCVVAGGLAGLVAGVETIILGARSLPPESAHYGYDMQPYYRLLTASPKVTLVTNSMRAKHGFTDYLDETTNEVQCIYNGVEVDHEANPAAEDEVRRTCHALGIPGDVRIVGGVFRFNREKMPLFWLEVAKAAIDAAERAPHAVSGSTAGAVSGSTADAVSGDPVFVIVGDGKLRKPMESFIRKHRLERRIFLVGLSKDVPAWLAVFDQLLLLSVFEGTPNVLLEAQSAGLPVVARDVGGCSECFLPGVTGQLIPEDHDPARAAAVVLSTLDGMERSPELRTTARDFVSGTFDIERAANRYLELYDRAEHGRIALVSDRTSAPLAG